MSDKIRVSFEATEDELCALSEMFKRMGHDDFHRLSSVYTKDELHHMKWGAEAVRDGLREAGYAPR